MKDATVDIVRQALAREIQPGEAVVLDLREVGFMDTSGLRYVLELTEKAAQDGFSLRLVRGPGPVQRVWSWPPSCTTRRVPWCPTVWIASILSAISAST